MIFIAARPPLGAEAGALVVLQGPDRPDRRGRSFRSRLMRPSLPFPAGRGLLAVPRICCAVSPRVPRVLPTRSRRFFLPDLFHGIVGSADRFFPSVRVGRSRRPADNRIPTGVELFGFRPRAGWRRASIRKELTLKTSLPRCKKPACGRLRCQMPGCSGPGLPCQACTQRTGLTAGLSAGLFVLALPSTSMPGADAVI